MLECPNCRKKTSEIKFTGAVLIATGVLEVQEGLVQSIGPLKAIQTIAVGDEWKSQQLELSCPSCGYSAGQQEFKLVVPCFITGETANAVIHTDLGTFHVVDRVADLAKRALTWNDAMLQSIVTREDIRQYV